MLISYQQDGTDHEATQLTANLVKFLYSKFFFIIGTYNVYSGPEALPDFFLGNQKLRQEPRGKVASLRGLRRSSISKEAES